MDSILSWDYAAMVFLNLGKYHNGGLDFFMWMNSQILIWLPVILMFIYVLVKNKKRDALAIIGMTITGAYATVKNAKKKAKTN